jgi:hypothetical protein
MTKILNLDALSATSQRELVLGGKTYPVPRMSVDNFIETTKVAEKLVADKAGMAAQIEATIEMITRAVPALTRDVLKVYDLATLGKIADYVRGEDVEGQEEAVQQQAAKAGEGDAGNVDTPA